MARARKKNEEVDVSRFDPLIEEALKAFGMRFHYTLNMLNRATSIESKRAKFAERKANKNKD